MTMYTGVHVAIEREKLCLDGILTLCVSKFVLVKGKDDGNIQRMLWMRQGICNDMRCLVSAQDRSSGKYSFPALDCRE